MLLVVVCGLFDLVGALGTASGLFTGREQTRNSVSIPSSSVLGRFFVISCTSLSNLLFVVC